MFVTLTTQLTEQVTPLSIQMVEQGLPANVDVNTDRCQEDWQDKLLPTTRPNHIQLKNLCPTTQSPIMQLKNLFPPTKSPIMQLENLCPTT